MKAKRLFSVAGATLLLAIAACGAREHAPISTMEMEPDADSGSADVNSSRPEVPADGRSGMDGSGDVALSDVQFDGSAGSGGLDAPSVLPDMAGGADASWD